MLPQVFQVLKASSAVTNIVGTNPPKIFKHGEAPQGTVSPYITWLLISGVPENNLSDPPPVDRQSVQIDWFHPTQAGVELLGDAIRDAIEAVTHCTSYQFFPRDAETRNFRGSLDCDFWGR